MSDSWDDRIQCILNRIGNAMRRGTGTHLSADDVQDLKVSFFGETCLEADPRPASVDSRRMAETASGLGSEGPTSAVAEGQTPLTHCSNRDIPHG